MSCLFSWVPRIEITWPSLPSLCPKNTVCHTPVEGFEEEFGLRPRTRKQSPSTGSDTSRCLHVSGSVVIVLALGLMALVLCREYLGSFLAWLAHLPGIQGPILFCLMFVAVSFPMVWGYIILNLGAGYLYGLFWGSVVTIVGANLGGIVAFMLMRKMAKDYVLKQLASYDNFRQIIRVIEGRQGFRIIMMTRLTPVPFGLQNALFSVAQISKRTFMGATLVGLMPTQILNAYMGTTLRSMEDVLAGKSDNTFVLFVQVAITVAVTWYVNQRMKSEVSKACEHDTMMRKERNMQLMERLPAHVHPAQSKKNLSLRPIMSVANIEALASGPIHTVHSVQSLALADMEHSNLPPTTEEEEGEEEHELLDQSFDTSMEAFGPLQHGKVSPPPEHHLPASTVIDMTAIDTQTSSHSPLLMPPSPPKATTSNGEFTRGHRRSRSAGPVLSSLVLKLGQGSMRGKRGPPKDPFGPDHSTSELSEQGEP